MDEHDDLVLPWCRFSGEGDDTFIKCIAWYYIHTLMNGATPTRCRLVSHDKPLGVASSTFQAIHFGVYMCWLCNVFASDLVEFFWASDFRYAVQRNGRGSRALKIKVHCDVWHRVAQFIVLKLHKSFLESWIVQTHNMYLLADAAMLTKFLWMARNCVYFVDSL